MNAKKSQSLILLAAVVGTFFTTVIILIASLDDSESSSNRWLKRSGHFHDFEKQDDNGNYIVKPHLKLPQLEIPALRKLIKSSHHVTPTPTKAVQKVPSRESEKDGRTKGPKPILKDSGVGNFELEPDHRTGPGEGGKPVYLSMEEKPEGDKSTREFGMNIFVSKKISMDRSVTDVRMPECKRWDYPTDLPDASVVLVFHNEGFSVILRTVHSIINRSPEHLLHEVVLIDDNSDYEDLKGPLDEYITRWKGKVKVYRNAQREGLIRARTIGAEKSTGKVVIFLDAHCEVGYNWLVPLLAVIREDRKVMACPIVDGIDSQTFEYRSSYSQSHYAGIFEWGFLYKESKVPQKELARRLHDSEPYNSPTHAGGLFAIDRAWFAELGYYDPGLEIWGGEQYELSFKIWQCGGGLKWVPCSHVGHIYRGGGMPRNRGGGRHPLVPLTLMNHLRVIETWFDDKYKEYFYRREPLSRDVKVSDVSKMLAIKEKLQCKNFTWYMENVAYDLEKHHPHPPANQYWGEIKEKEGDQCWDIYISINAKVGLFGCHGQGGNQLVRLNVEGQLGVGERCLEPSPQGDVRVVVCSVQPTGYWNYDSSTALLRHTNINKCAERSGQSVIMSACDPNQSKQRWVINEIHIYRRQSRWL